MKSAIENGLVNKNPCDGIRAGGYESRIKTPLSKDQQLRLMDAVAGKRCELFVLLCLYAGLRREEALGLMWSNVYLDTDAPYIDVRHTVTFDKGRPVHSDSLKSNAARRSVPIPMALSDALKEAKKSASSVFVVPAVREGGIMSLAAFRRMWEMVETSYGKHIEAHVLRHTYITELCASGLDIKKIQYLAGHGDVTMTLRVYAHVTQNTPQELSGSIVKIFSGTTPGTSDESEAGNG